MAHNGKPMPNLDQESTKVLNLTVLQRIDPFVEEILMTAAHVTFYEFNIEQNQWSRKDVEGSLFVVKRNTQPRFQFIVMNRRNTDNLVENLLGDFEYEVQVPYLLYRNASQEVNGIWFYNQHECEEIANLFGRILNAYSKVPAKSKRSPAKSEFEELEAVPTSAIIEGPLEPPSSSTSTATGVPDDSFVNFCGASLSMGPNTVNVPIITQQHLPPPLSFSSSHAPNLIPSPVPALQTPSLPLPSSSSNPLIALLDNSETTISSRTTNLVKPSFFSPTLSSSSSLLMMPPPMASSVPPTAPPLHTPVTLQSPYGTPLLQPFPPPTPSPSLTPAANNAPVITRDKVRDALLRLVQNNQFIDMVHREIVNSHY